MNTFATSEMLPLTAFPNGYLEAGGTCSGEYLLAGTLSSSSSGLPWLALSNVGIKLGGSVIVTSWWTFIDGAPFVVRIEF